MSRNLRPLLTRVLLLSVLAAAPYLSSLNGKFVFDDHRRVENNPTLESVDGLIRIWTEPSSTPQYYPLTYTSFWLERHLWGQNPVPYHVANICLHVLNALLVWQLLRLLRVPGALVAAALFAVHPVQVESVAYIIERKTLLSGMFALVAGIAWVRFVGGGSRVFYAVALVMFACAMLSKTAVCAAPFVLLLLAWWKHPAMGRRNLLRIMPFLVLSAGLGSVTYWREGLGQSVPMLPVGQRIWIAGRAVWFYVAKLAWPCPLVATYPRWQVAGEWWWALPTISVLIILAAAWFFRDRFGRGLFVALASFVLLLLPSLGLVSFDYLRVSFVADHFQYLPSVALLALAVSACERVIRRAGKLPRRFAAVSAAVLLLLLCELSREHARIFASDEVLWRDTLEKNPSSFTAHYNLGMLLLTQGKLAEATPHLDTVLRLQAAGAYLANDEAAALHNNLGWALSRAGNLSGALQHLREALRLDPGYVQAHNNLGAVLAATGDLQGAIEQFTAAAEAGSAEGYTNRAVALGLQGKFEEAENDCRAALRIQPGNKAAQLTLERMRRAQGRMP